MQQSMMKHFTMYTDWLKMCLMKYFIILCKICETFYYTFALFCAVVLAITLCRIYTDFLKNFVFLLCLNTLGRHCICLLDLVQRNMLE